METINNSALKEKIIYIHIFKKINLKKYMKKGTTLNEEVQYLNIGNSTSNNIEYAHNLVNNLPTDNLT